LLHDPSFSLKCPDGSDPLKGAIAEYLFLPLQQLSVLALEVSPLPDHLEGGVCVGSRFPCPGKYRSFLSPCCASFFVFFFFPLSPDVPGGFCFPTVGSYPSAKNCCFPPTHTGHFLREFLNPYEVFYVIFFFFVVFKLKFFTLPSPPPTLILIFQKSLFPP